MWGRAVSRRRKGRCAVARAERERSEAVVWAAWGKKLAGPRGKVWAGLFGLEEEVGQAGWFLGFGVWASPFLFSFLIQTLLQSNTI